MTYSFQRSLGLEALIVELLLLEMEASGGAAAGWKHVPHPSLLPVRFSW